VGDPSDNIPGVRGLGKKSVGEFLRTLEEYAQNNGMITTDPREPILTKFFSKSMFRNFLSVKDAEFFQQAVFSSKFAKFFSDTDQVLVLFECLMLVTLPSPLCKTTSDDLMITLKKRRDEAKHRKDLMQFKSLCERWETFTFFAKRSLDSLAALSGGTHATRRIKKRR
jgi:5'-3' exonuclease